MREVDWSLFFALLIALPCIFGLGRESGRRAEREDLRRKFHDNVKPRRRDISDLPDIDRWQDSARAAHRRRDV